MTSSNQPTAEALPAELAQIAAEAEAIAPTPAAAGAVPGAIDYTAEARGLIDIGAELLGGVGPRTEAALTEERRAKIAAAAGPLMQKYGLSLGVVFERWGPEINFLFALVVVGKPVLLAVQADREEAKAAEQAKAVAQRDPDPQPARPAVDPYSAAFSEV